MVIGVLPEDGELRLGATELPQGRQVMGGFGSGQPVAWATADPVPQPGRVWAVLSQEHDDTGLIPILLSSLPGEPRRPWDEGEFTGPAGISELDPLDAGSILERIWTDALPEPGDTEEEQYFAEDRAPFDRAFPGLAPAEPSTLPSSELNEALDSLPPARIGLVPAGRPADVLSHIGWTGGTNRYETPLQITAVLRSWEDRFGARLLEVGFASVRLLVQRPPRTLEAAERIAAEQYGFADEFGRAARSVSAIAASLVNAPFWYFWWD
jgi:Domain of unknown function (DUF4253)